jgi:hypothetical protein
VARPTTSSSTATRGALRATLVT